jgi:hypothetical protein
MRCSAILSQDGSNRYGTVGPVTPAMTPFSPSANPLTPGRHDDATASYGLGTAHEEVTDRSACDDGRVWHAACGIARFGVRCHRDGIAACGASHRVVLCVAALHCSSAVGLLHCSAHC